MQDQGKTKEELIDELNKMRSKVAEFEAAEGKSLGPGKILRQSEGLREIEKNLRAPLKITFSVSGFPKISLFSIM